MKTSRFVNNSLIALTILAYVVQFLIDFSTINIAASSIILCATLSIIFYLRWTNALESHPLSSFALFGFCLTSITGALWVQSATWTSVSEDLREPLVTFSLLTLYLAIAISAHSIYRLNKNSTIGEKHSVLKRLFYRIGLFDSAQVSVLWGVGFIGLISLLLSVIFPVANGISYLVWVPFLIPYYREQLGEGYCNVKLNYIFLGLHTLLIASIAIAFNTRGILFSGFASLVLLFLLGLMRSKKVVSTTMLLRGGLFLLIIALLDLPASNLVTAMAAARTFKGQPIKVFKSTIENFNNPELLEKYVELAKREKYRSQYDEKYIDNPLLARLITTKFHDNAIYFAGKLSDKDKESVTRLTGDFLWTVLPQPILDVLKIDIKKDNMLFSMGDVLSNYAIGTQLAGERTGSIFGQGWAVFGPLFFIVYFFMCWILFATIDLFFISIGKAQIFSIIGVLNLWPNFLFGITADSLNFLFINVVRGVIQSVFLYLIVFSIVKFFLGLSHSQTSIKHIDI